MQIGQIKPDTLVALPNGETITQDQLFSEEHTKQRIKLLNEKQNQGSHGFKAITCCITTIACCLFSWQKYQHYKQQ
jgi:hypothetical protein